MSSRGRAGPVRPFKIVCPRPHQLSVRGGPRAATPETTQIRQAAMSGVDFAQYVEPGDFERFDSREQMLLAAERLIAEKGPGVALRDIAVAAGQRNNSAVHYHFGSREGLFKAVVQYRQTPLEKQRASLLAEYDRMSGTEGDDMGTLLMILLYPQFSLVKDDRTCHFARFLERIRRHPTEPHRGEALSLTWPTVNSIVGRLHELMHHPAKTRVVRLLGMASSMYGIMADYEDYVVRKNPPASDCVAREAEIVAMLTGMLASPVADLPVWVGQSCARLTEMT